MEYKRNDATLHRPGGERVIDAPYVYTSLEKYIDQLKDEEAWNRYDRNGITIFKTDNLTTVLTCLHKGAAIKDNTVDGLFQLLVVDGKVRVTTDEGDIEMKEREMITLHPNIHHNIEALKKSTLLLQTITLNGKPAEQFQNT